MDEIQKYARNLDPGIRQCLLTQSAAATPSPILPPHPQVWIHAAQPLGLGLKRQTTARPLMRANLLLRAPIHRMHHSNERPVGGAKIGHAEEPVSAAGTALSPCYLLPPHACSRHKLLAPGRQRATSVPPDHLQRNNEENRPRTARGCHVVPVGIVAKANCLLRNLTIGN